MKPWDGKLRVATQIAGARYAGRSLRCKGRALRKTAKLKKWKGPASRRLSPAAGSLQRTRMAAVFLIALIALLSLFLYYI